MNKNIPLKIKDKNDKILELRDKLFPKQENIPIKKVNNKIAIDFLPTMELSTGDIILISLVFWATLNSTLWNNEKLTKNIIDLFLTTYDRYYHKKANTLSLKEFIAYLEKRKKQKIENHEKQFIKFFLPFLKEVENILKDRVKIPWKEE